MTDDVIFDEHLSAPAVAEALGVNVNGRRDATAAAAAAAVFLSSDDRKTEDVRTSGTR